MIRSVMQHVTALAKASQVGEPVVGGVVVQMRRGEHDAGQADVRGIDQVTPVPPRPRSLVEPAPVRQAADLSQMRARAALAAAAGTLEPDTPAQRRPVWRVERAERGADRHAPLMPPFYRAGDKHRRGRCRGAWGPHPTKWAWTSTRRIESWSCRRS